MLSMLLEIIYQVNNLNPCSRNLAKLVHSNCSTVNHPFSASPFSAFKCGLNHSLLSVLQRAWLLTVPKWSFKYKPSDLIDIKPQIKYFFHTNIYGCASWEIYKLTYSKLCRGKTMMKWINTTPVRGEKESLQIIEILDKNYRILKILIPSRVLAYFGFSLHINT